MIETFRNVASLLLGYALMIMANALFNTLLGIRMELEQFGATVTGMVMSAYFVGLLIGARSVSRVDHPGRAYPLLWPVRLHYLHHGPGPHPVGGPRGLGHHAHRVGLLHGRHDHHHGKLVECAHRQPAPGPGACPGT
jgi:hypothetical protein